MQHSVVVNMPNSGDKSFGVPTQKVWKAHFHLTLSNVNSEELMEAAKIIGAKCTTIDLHRDTKSQRDRMLTKYQSDLDTTLMLQCVEKLENAGFNVVRYKLERMFKHVACVLFMDLSKENYGEVHIKTSASDPEVETNFFRISSNVEELDYRFYNARLYSAEDKLRFNEAYDMLLNSGVQIKGYHIEQVVVDSNLNLDAWWA